ncbi:MAG: hypothetical protein IJ910_10090 [Bacteroidaceae bacterium]|nr:hypothetical protein [Bacteroidaceae bacterium]
MELKDLAGVLAVTLSLLIPIVAIICGVITSINKKKNETELRKALIENHTDPESIKLLVEEQQEKSNKFIMLRWGCVLLGAGLGAAISGWAGTDPDNLYFWLPIVAGMGLGMLISFIIETKMTKDEKNQDLTEQP